MNQDIERTEELLKYANKKGSKKKLIVIVAILAVLAVGGGLFAGLKIHNNSQITEKLNKADALLKEGDYKAALTAYEDVIEIDENNAAAYEGAGDSHRGLGKPKEALVNYEESIKKDKKRKSPYPKAIRTATELGDDKKAEKLVKDMNKNVEGAEKVTVEQMIMGCTPANMQSGGTVCESTEGLFIANKPNKGDISLIDNDGKEKKVFTYGDLGKNQYLGRLNYWDGWIYYAVIEYFDDIDGDSTSATMRRVKIDGSSDMELACDMIVNPGNIAIIKGKIYYTQWPFMGDSTLNRCDINGENVEELTAINGDFICIDGNNIYYSRSGGAESPLDSIYNYNIGSGESMEVKANEYFNLLGGQDNKLYGFGGAAGGTMDIKALDLSDNSIKKVGETLYVDNANLCESKIYWMSYREYLSYGETDNSDKDFLEVRETGLTGDEGKTVKIKLNKSEVFKDDNPENAYGVLISDLCVVNDKLYYTLHREMSDEKADGLELTITPVFGCINLDGTENELYGY